jgi:hypothetical protein
VRPELHARADELFERRVRETGARDPREFYRRLLKDLRGRDEAGYREMAARYEAEVVQPVASGERDPLEAWLSYGRALAERALPGTLVRVDATGRSSPAPGTLSWRDLLLQLPDERRSRAVPVGIPPEPSPAQRATLELLVRGRVRLPEAD